MSDKASENTPSSNHKKEKTSQGKTNNRNNDSNDKQESDETGTAANEMPVTTTVSKIESNYIQISSTARECIEAYSDKTRKVLEKFCLANFYDSKYVNQPS